MVITGGDTGQTSLLIRFPTFHDRSCVSFTEANTYKCISLVTFDDNVTSGIPFRRNLYEFSPRPWDYFCKISRGKMQQECMSFSRGAVCINTGLYVLLRGKRHFRATGNLLFRFRISRLIATGFMVRANAKLTETQRVHVETCVTLRNKPPARVLRCFIIHYIVLILADR